MEQILTVKAIYHTNKCKDININLKLNYSIYPNSSYKNFIDTTTKTIANIFCNLFEWNFVEIFDPIIPPQIDPKERIIPI